MQLKSVWVHPTNKPPSLLSLLQAYMDGVAIFTGALYGWGLQATSLFLGLVGLGMAPVNIAVGALSTRVSDRAMVLAATAASAAALVILTRSAASAAAYFGGGVALFVASVVLEGTATSLMSKVIFPGLAVGVLNAGLLSTEAGTFGRFSGNAALTLIGRATGVETKAELGAFASELHGGLAVVCVALALLLAWTWRRLKG